MENAEMKIEASKLAFMILTQYADGKAENRPLPDEILIEAKKFYEWFAGY